MIEFKEAVELFAWGFLIGFFLRPAWQLLTEFWIQAKKAKEEW
jgi:hypothetical protein